ncbi:MAG TPA: tRNA lysidine(34) synthetase TilS [Thermoanaerobaculia bacterium]|jgi:tRNA(Ile)-lysidine synthase
MLRERICQFFVNEGVSACRIAVAVSGGVDSTALLLALTELRGDGFEVVAAHVNHHLRGADSDSDEAFLRELCTRLAIPLRVADGTLDPERVRERGIEAAAREIRYARLTAIRDEERAAYVATAHQKNDQAETVLMRLLTGSGLAGLRGIHPMRADGFIRPLLDVTRPEIEAYLREQNVVARFDRSNDDPRFLRNRVRAFLRDLDATDNLAKIAGDARAQWPLVERAIDEAERAGVTVLEHETRFERWPDDEWLRASLLHRHIQRLDPHARDFDAARIASELGGIKRMSVTKHLELVRKGDVLILRTPPQPAEDFELELSENTPVYIATLNTTIHLLRPAPSAPRPATRQTIQLPDERGTFIVRNRRKGDRFQPLGLPSPKKLKDFLIDRKIAADVRDRLPLLVWNGEIVWVAGVEVSERFKVTGTAGVLYEVWTDDRDQAGLQR